MTGDIDALLAMQAPTLIAGADDGIRVIAPGPGRTSRRGRVRLAAMRESSRIPLFVGWMDYIAAWLDGSARNVTEEIERAGLGILKIQDDPEAIFQEGWLSATSASTSAGSPISSGRSAKGYFVAPTLTRWPQFDALRGEPRFQALLAPAEAGRARALAAFREAGGERLLGAARRP